MPPHTLYKYLTVNAHTSDIFCRKRIFFSARKQLNDPFDCSPYISTEISLNEFRKWLEAGMRTLRPDISEDELVAAIDCIIKAEYPLSKERFQVIRDDIEAQLLSGLGIFSTSESYQSVTMWSHYAAMHRGICLEVDASRLPDNYGIHPVTYEEERPIIHITSELTQEVRIACAFTKNKEWAYEREWRIVLQSKCGASELPCGVEFPKGFVTGVILGAKISPDDAERVRAWVKMLDPVPCLYQGRLNDRAFLVDREHIKVE